MGRRCCIVTCKNATIDECDERVSFFRVPSDRSVFHKWLGAIESTGSKLSKASAVCERHFKEDEIRRMAVLKDSFGNIIFQRPLTKCSLAKNAVPSIFDDNPELARKRKKRRISKKPEEPKISEPVAVENNANDDLAVTYSNILLTFPSENGGIQQLCLSPSHDQLELSTTVKDHDLCQKSGSEQPSDTIVPSYVFHGLETLYNDGFHHVNFDKTDSDKSLDHTGESIISIILRPQDEIVNLNSINDLQNNIENISTNNASDHTDSSIGSNTNQSSHNYANGEIEKEITVPMPESEYVILNSSDEQKNEEVAPKRKRKRKDTEPENESPASLPETHIQKNIRTFDHIFYNSHKIKLPSPMWGYHRNNEDRNVIIFSKARWFKDVLMPPNYEKQVVFHESDSVKIYINNKFSPLQVRRPGDMHEMELILKYVDEVMVCAGGPDLNDVIVQNCAQKDYAVSRWRHKLCPIIVGSDETVCKFCTTINNNNKVHRYPKKKRLPFGRRRPVDEES